MGIPQFRTESRALWYGMGRNIWFMGQILFGIKWVDLEVNLYILFCVFSLMADICLFYNVLKIK